MRSDFLIAAVGLPSPGCAEIRVDANRCPDVCIRARSSRTCRGPIAPPGRSTWRFPLHGRRRPTRIFHRARMRWRSPAAAVVAVLTAEDANWDIALFASLLVFSIVSDISAAATDLGREDLGQLPVARAGDGVPRRRARRADRRRHDRRRLAALARLVAWRCSTTWSPTRGSRCSAASSSPRSPSAPDLSRERRVLLPARCSSCSCSRWRSTS